MMMASEVHLSYDQVPYPSLSHYCTHPDGHATLARLLGLQPAPVESCRVLELGCGVGGNLIPMACTFPGSEFTGIDLSGRQIAAGHEKIALLGLTNVHLLQMDILEVTPEFGQFDYIIAHGVYSWVPPAVQEKILEVCRQNLAPQGLAFISYNTYPGWHLINIARGIMRYYTRDLADPAERAQKARSILDWFANASESDTNGYYGYLKMYASYLAGSQDDQDPKADAALLHDELEELNQPVYFHEFAERAANHGLQYLGEMEQASIGKHLTENLEHLQKDFPSFIEMQQSYDFLQNQTFRRSLLCHQGITPNRKLTPRSIADLYVASGAEPVSEEPDIAGKGIEQFRIRSGATFSTDHPLSKAAMMCLADAWPRPLRFKELYQAALARLQDEKTLRGDPPDEAPNKDIDPNLLAANLLKAFDYSSSLVEFHTCDLKLSSVPGPRPAASPWAMLQAQEQNWVTNLRHERVQLDNFDRFLLTELDGRKDRSELLELLMNGPVAEGLLTLDTEGKTVTREEQRALLAEEIDHRLDWLAKAALVIEAP